MSTMAWEMTRPSRVGANHSLNGEMLRAPSDAIAEVAASFASSRLLSLPKAA